MTERTRSVSRARQERVPFDAYLTPRPLALTLCQWLKEKGVGVQESAFCAMEPSAGHGDFVWAARQVWPSAFIVANEIQPMLVEKPVMREYLLAMAKAKKVKAEPPPDPVPTLATPTVLIEAGATTVFCEDFLTADLSAHGPFNLIVGNPPYTQGGGAEAHTRKALTLLAPGGVLAYVLKMHFRGTAVRIDFWNEHPFACDPPISPRPDFTGDGRDTVEYTFYCWHRPIENSAWKIHCAPAIEWSQK